MTITWLIFETLGTIAFAFPALWWDCRGVWIFSASPCLLS